MLNTARSMPMERTVRPVMPLLYHILLVIAIDWEFLEVPNIKLDTLVQIMDCLDVTADDIFRDVIKNGYVNRTSRLSDEVAMLPSDEQQRIYEVLEALLRTAFCFRQRLTTKFDIAHVL